MSNLDAALAKTKSKLANPPKAAPAPVQLHPATGQTIQVPVDEIQPNPYQPRQSFPLDDLATMAASIKEHGIISPLTIYYQDDTPHLIAGERRLRGAKAAGYKTVPCYVRASAPSKVALLALIENMERKDLNALEKAEALERLRDEFEFKQKDLAQQLGLAANTVSEILSIAELPISIKLMARQYPGSFTQGLLVELKKLEDKDQAKEIATTVAHGDMNPSEARQKIRRMRRSALVSSPGSEQAPESGEPEGTVAPDPMPAGPPAPPSQDQSPGLPLDQEPDGDDTGQANRAGSPVPNVPPTPPGAGPDPVQIKPAPLDENSLPTAPYMGTIEYALWNTLHNTEGASERWLVYQEEGKLDTELKEVISDEFGTGYWLPAQKYPTVYCKGGSEPAFGFGQKSAYDTPTYAGRHLINAVRTLMHIPYPQDSEPDASQDPARELEEKAEKLRAKILILTNQLTMVEVSPLPAKPRDYLESSLEGLITAAHRVLHDIAKEETEAKAKNQVHNSVPQPIASLLSKGQGPESAKTEMLQCTGRTQRAIYCGPCIEQGDHCPLCCRLCPTMRTKQSGAMPLCQGILTKQDRALLFNLTEAGHTTDDLRTRFSRIPGQPLTHEQYTVQLKLAMQEDRIK